MTSIMETVRLTVEVPDTIRRALRVYAEECQATMGQVLEGILTGDKIKNEVGQAISFTVNEFAIYHKRIIDRSKK